MTPPRTKADSLGAAAAALAALSTLAVPAANPDLFWHLSAARRWLETGALPSSDWLSFTLPGAPWLNFEWLVQLLWHGLFSAAGYPALWTLKVLVLAAAAWMISRAAGRHAQSMSAKAFAGLLWVFSLGAANDLRPENFSLLFFAALLSFLEARRLSPDKSRLRFETPALAAFFALWSNLHPGWAYGLILLAVYLSIEALRKRRWKELAPLPAAALAVLLNPHGTGAYEILWLHAAALKDAGAHLNEWRPPPLTDARQAPFWALFAAAACSAAVSWAKKIKMPPEHTAAGVLFAASALRFSRTIPYFAAVAVVLIFAAAAKTRWGAKRPRRPAVLCALAAALFWLHTVPRALAGPAFFDPAYAPLRLAEFLRRETKVLGALRMYNTWQWGGYLGWRNPGQSVFQDGRYIFHPLLERRQKALASPQAFGEFLAEFKIDLVALERGSWMRSVPVRTRAGVLEVPRPFYLDYLPDTDWLLAYWDAKGYVFVRRSAVPEPWARSHAYTAFRPDDLRAAALLADSGQIPRTVLREEVARFCEDMDTLPGEKGDSTAARAWLEEISKE